MAFTAIRPITITYPMVGTLTDFQFLFSTTYPLLATVANGGVLTSTLAYDLGFYGALLTPTTVDPASKLDWEIEHYTATSGEIVAWVRIPSYFTGQVIYLAAGDASIITPQWNPAGVWVTTNPGGTGFRCVLHLPNTANQYLDSCQFAQNATPTGAPGTIAGQIDGGISLNGTSQFLQVSGASYTQVTLHVYLSCWFYPTAFSANVLIQKDPNFLNYRIAMDASGHLTGGANTRDFPAAVSSLPMTLNAWNLLVAGWEGGPPGFNPQPNFVVLNGVRTDAGVAYDSGGYTGLDPLYIGADSLGAPHLPGKIDEFRLWTAPTWSQLRASAEYANQLNPAVTFSLPTGSAGCVITL